MFSFSVDFYCTDTIITIMAEENIVENNGHEDDSEIMTMDPDTLRGLLTELAAGRAEGQAAGAFGAGLGCLG